MTEERAMAKMRAILEGLPSDVCRRVARWTGEVFGGPMTEAERAKRHREASRTTVTEERHENVTELRDELQPKRTKVSNNSQGLDYTPGFRSFWSLYPRRIGKGAAFLSWKRSGCEGISEAVVKAVREQLPHLVREGGQFRPLPATWLNQRRWEDDPFGTSSEGTTARPTAPEPTPLTDEEHAEVQQQIRGVVKKLAAEKT